MTNFGQGALGAYLKARRAKVDPVAVGFQASRRRTPGLRREEVALRANISAIWYTCLEQGKGGAPSPGVLDRLARALMLTDAEREHLFLIGLGRPPKAQYQANNDITPRLQRLLDKLDPTPAMIKTATWDVLAWNKAATVFLGDYGSLPPEKRNSLRIIFLDPAIRERQSDWENMARQIVAGFRTEVSRAGAAAEAQPLIDELCKLSDDFARMWADNDVSGGHGETIKEIQHPTLGIVRFEYSVLSVDARPDLQVVIYNPIDKAGEAGIAKLIDGGYSNPLESIAP
jgi:transcriptional regulator with XRE-family HTH domain